MLPCAERIPLCHQVQPCTHVKRKELFHDLRNLFIAHDRYFRIGLDQITQRGGMIHLHMLHNHVIQPAAANTCARFSKYCLDADASTVSNTTVFSSNST